MFSTGLHPRQKKSGHGLFLRLFIFKLDSLFFSRLCYGFNRLCSNLSVCLV
jgi:hypothetical protein